MSSRRFDGLLAQTHGRLDALQVISQEWPGIKVLDDRREAMARWNRDRRTVNNDCLEMERLIQMMPPKDRDFCESDRDDCRLKLENLEVQFAAFDEQLKAQIAELKSRPPDFDEEYDRETRNIKRSGGNKMAAALAIGNSVLNEQNKAQNMLAEDRQIMENIDGNLDNIDGHVATSGARARAMLIRAFCQGCFVWMVNVLLTGSLVTILLWKAGLF